MGQKVSPIGFRLVRRKEWQSLWYSVKNLFGDLLLRDKAIRDYLMKKPICVGTSRIIIRRTSGKTEVKIVTARPGLVIGRKGSEIDQLKAELKKFTGGDDVWVEVEEIKRPDLDATLVAEGISRQISRRMPFRRVLKKAIQTAMDAGAAGIKVQLSGRIGGAEIARSEGYMKGRVPLHTIRADIDYGVGRAETTYGSIGVKVWINHGENVTSGEGG